MVLQVLRELNYVERQGVACCMPSFAHVPWLAERAPGASQAHLAQSGPNAQIGPNAQSPTTQGGVAQSPPAQSPNATFDVGPSAAAPNAAAPNAAPSIAHWSGAPGSRWQQRRSRR